MRALRCHESGTLQRLSVDHVPDPIPADGHVLVDVAAAAVNYVDTLMVLGRYQIPIPAPFIPGVDIAGTVTAVGAGAERFRVGDRVHGMALLGGFAEKVVVPESLLRATPDNLPCDLACTTGSTYRTAYDVLATVARVNAGENVVVLGASGAVGSAAIGIAKALGARVIACGSTPTKLDFCRSLGADEVIEYSCVDLKSAIKNIGGADIVIDLVGGASSEQALRATNAGGRFVVVGFASGDIPRVATNLVLLKGSTIVGYEIADFERRHPSQTARNRIALEDLIRSGEVTPPITSRFSLDHAPEALTHVAGRHKSGITVLECHR